VAAFCLPPIVIGASRHCVRVLAQSRQWNGRRGGRHSVIAKDRAVMDSRGPGAAGLADTG
jgi:hypothetical protein